MEDPKGTLIIIGGAEDKKHEMVILKRIIKELNGDEKLLVLTTATKQPEVVGEEYTGHHS